VKHLDKFIDNIYNSKHRIAEFTPNQIQQSYGNDETIILDKAYDTEFFFKKVTYLNKCSKIEI
jgi:hypothetical protein